jgi:hypothetical protein
MGGRFVEKIWLANDTLDLRLGVLENTLLEPLLELDEVLELRAVAAAATAAICT